MVRAKQNDSRTEITPTWLKSSSGGWLMAVHVQPGARSTRVVGEHGGRLKIAVGAAAQDGAANELLLRFVANQLGIARSSVVLTSGASSRIKRVRIDAGAAVTAADFAARLCDACT